VNWGTTERDVDALVDVVTELGTKLARALGAWRDSFSLAM
jgi:hypothetical protein